MTRECSTCHTVAGTPAGGNVAPDLTHVASRATIAAGTLPMSRGQPLRLGRRSAGREAGQQHALCRPQRRRAPRRFRLSGDAEMTVLSGKDLPRDGEQLQGAALDARLARTWGDRAGPVGLDHHHRPQEDRPALHRHRDDLHGARRRLGSADAAAAGRARKSADDAGPLQPALHHARHDDDVPVRRAGDGGDGHLPRAADDRHAQHLLPASQRVQLLDVSRRRSDDLGRLRAQHRPGRRLVLLSAALRPAILAGQARRHLGADDHLHRGRGPRRRSRDHRHHPQAARAGHDAGANADLRLGDAGRRLDGDLLDAGGRARLVAC